MRAASSCLHTLARARHLPLPIALRAHQTMVLNNPPTCSTKRALVCSMPPCAPLATKGATSALVHRAGAAGPRLGGRWFGAAPFDGIDRGVRAGTGTDEQARQANMDAHADGALLLVFLEGATGVGKSTLTGKLQKMGYFVHFEGFVDLCETNPDYPPTSALLTLKWTHKLLVRFAHLTL